MIPVVEIAGARVFLGDCRDVLRTLPDNSVDSIVTDPPYELGFMGKKWDSSGIAYDVTVWQECLRVLKPGGHLLAFGGSRTYHRLGVAIEDAGFEIRDTIAWISSKTFPKSLNVAKALEKSGRDGSSAQGWGTGLKQVVEPVVLARKPLAGTVADNFEAWGVGGLNIDGSRIGTETRTNFAAGNGKAETASTTTGKSNGGVSGGFNYSPDSEPNVVQGRWPANVILDEVTAGLLDEQSGIQKDGVAVNRNSTPGAIKPMNLFGDYKTISQDSGYGGQGGASRFFYVAKASKRDRNEGLDELEAMQARNFAQDKWTLENMPFGEKPRQNFHPTVKPTQLMRYLIKLVTPSGGTVLDPFTGSGSTGKAALLDGYRFIGAELTEEYLPIIEGRLKWASEQVEDEDVALF